MRFKWQWIAGSAVLLLLLLGAEATFLQADLLAAPGVLLVDSTLGRSISSDLEASAKLKAIARQAAPSSLLTGR